MQWYYAEDTDKRGPLTELEIHTLISSGHITATTLVWTAGMATWQPAAETALFSTSTQTPWSTDVQRCVVTGRLFPLSQMIQTPHGWVSAEGKDRYYQTLRENVPFIDASASNARRDGKRIVIPVQGGQLPPRCVKTNLPLSSTQTKVKTLYWCNPWVFLALLLNILVLLILYLVLRKKVILAIPLSDEGRRLVRNHAIIATLIAVSGFALLVYAIANSPQAAVLTLPGLILLLGAIIYGNRKGTLLRVVRIKDGFAWLDGASRAYVESLPPR